MNERLILSIILVVVLGYGAFDAVTFDRAARILPLVIGIPTFLLSLVSLGIEIHSRRTGKVTAGRGMESHQAHKPMSPEQQRERRRQEFINMGWLLLQFALIVVLGFIWALPIFLVLFLRIRGRQRWPVVIGVALGVFIVFYGLLYGALRLPLYSGFLPLPPMI